MKTYKQFISEKNDGTYVAVRFSDESNKKLKAYAESLNLKPIKDFHATIVYSPTTLDVPIGDTSFNTTLIPKSLKYLGEVGNKYRALALVVHSDDLQTRYDYYVDKKNFKSRFNSYIQHISLAYQPSEGININELPLPDFEIEVINERVEKLNSG
jgi:hypothetical protein